MFKSEWFIYDIYFVGIIILLFMIYKFTTEMKLKRPKLAGGN